MNNINKISKIKTYMPPPSITTVTFPVATASSAAQLLCPNLSLSGLFVTTSHVVSAFSLPLFSYLPPLSHNPLTKEKIKEE